MFSTQPMQRALISLKADSVVSVELQMGVVKAPYSILSEKKERDEQTNIIESMYVCIQVHYP